MIETNNYAKWIKSRSNLKKKSRMTKWYDTTEEEIKKFIALTLYIESQKKKNLEGKDLFVKLFLFSKIIGNLIF